jgi:hypothetical protein
MTRSKSAAGQVRRDELQRRQDRNDDEDHGGPAQRPIGDGNQGPAIRGVMQSSFAIKQHRGIVPEPA